MPTSPYLDDEDDGSLEPLSAVPDTLSPRLQAQNKLEPLAQKPRLGSTGGMLPEQGPLGGQPVVPQVPQQMQWDPDPIRRQQQAREEVARRTKEKFDQARPFAPSSEYKGPDAYQLAQGERQAEREGLMQRQQRVSEMRQKQAEFVAQQKDRNAQRQAQFEGTGQKFYRDPYGELQAVIDPNTGSPSFTPGEWEKGQDAQGLPAMTRRGKTGQPEFKRPKITAPVDPRDEHMWADMGDGESQRYMKISDAMSHPDVGLARQAMAANTRRNAALRKDSLAGPENELKAVDMEIAAKQAEHDDIETTLGKISAAAQTDPVYRQMSEDLAKRQMQISDELEKGGPLMQRKRIAGLSKNLVDAVARRDQWIDQEQEIIARLQQDGVTNFASDPTFTSNRASLIAAVNAAALAKRQIDAHAEQIKTPPIPAEKPKEEQGMGMNIVKGLVSGALDAGLYSGIQGAIGAADTVSRKVAVANALGNEYERLGGTLGELERAQMQVPSAKRAGMIDKIKGRMAEMEQAAQPQIRAIEQQRDGLRGAAKYVGEAREGVREVFDTTEKFQKSFFGQTVNALGQAVGSLPLYAIPGVGPASTIGQIYQQGYDDAKEKGASDEDARDSGMANVPSAALDVLGDKLIIGRILKAAKGKMTVGHFIKEVTASMASEGVTEGLQQIWTNLVARDLVGYDKNRKIDDQFIESVLIGAIVGGTTTGVGKGIAAITSKEKSPPAAASPAGNAGPAGAPPAGPAGAPPASPAAPAGGPADTGITGADVPVPPAPPITAADTARSLSKQSSKKNIAAEVAGVFEPGKGTGDRVYVRDPDTGEMRAVERENVPQDNLETDKGKKPWIQSPAEKSAAAFQAEEFANILVEDLQKVSGKSAEEILAMREPDQGPDDWSWKLQHEIDYHKNPNIIDPARRTKELTEGLIKSNAEWDAKLKELSEKSLEARNSKRAEAIKRLEELRSEAEQKRKERQQQFTQAIIESKKATLAAEIKKRQLGEGEQTEMTGEYETPRQSKIDSEVGLGGAKRERSRLDLGPKPDIGEVGIPGGVELSGQAQKVAEQEGEEYTPPDKSKQNAPKVEGGPQGGAPEAGPGRPAQPGPVVLTGPAAAAQTETSTATTESGSAPQPKMPDLESSSDDDIHKWDESVQEHDRNMDVRVLGAERAGEYRKLHRIANGKDTAKADAASKRIAAIEATLTSAQKDDLFGRNLPDNHIDPDLASQIGEKVGSISSSDDLSTLGMHASSLIQAALRSRASGTVMSNVGQAILKRAFKKAKELGHSYGDLVKAAFAYRSKIEGADVYELAGVTEEQYQKFIDELDSKETPPTQSTDALQKQSPATPDVLAAPQTSEGVRSGDTGLQEPAGTVTPEGEVGQEGAAAVQPGDAGQEESLGGEKAPDNVTELAEGKSARIGAALVLREKDKLDAKGKKAFKAYKVRIGNKVFSLTSFPAFKNDKSRPEQFGIDREQGGNYVPLGTYGLTLDEAVQEIARDPEGYDIKSKTNPNSIRAVRSKDFQETGNYDVKVGDRTFQIFRDPEDRLWYLNGPGHFSERVLSIGSKDDALYSLWKGITKWTKLVDTGRTAKEDARAQAAAPSKTQPAPQGAKTEITPKPEVSEAPATVATDDEAAIEAAAATQQGKPAEAPKAEAAKPVEKPKGKTAADLHLRDLPKHDQPLLKLYRSLKDSTGFRDRNLAAQLKQYIEGNDSGMDLQSLAKKYADDLDGKRMAKDMTLDEIQKLKSRMFKRSALVDEIARAGINIDDPIADAAKSEHSDPTWPKATVLLGFWGHADISEKLATSKIGAASSDPAVAPAPVKSEDGQTVTPTETQVRNVAKLADKQQLKVQREFLNDAVKKAVASAPEEEVMTDAGKAETEAVNKMEAAAMNEAAKKLGTSSVVYNYKGKLDANGSLLLDIRRRHAEHVTIEVPGDGTFRVLNTKQALQDFGDKAIKGVGIMPKATYERTMSTKPSALPSLVKSPKSEDVAKAAELSQSQDETRHVLLATVQDGKYTVSTDGRRMFVALGGGGLKLNKNREAVFNNKTGNAEKYPNWRQVAPKFVILSDDGKISIEKPKDAQFDGEVDTGEALRLVKMASLSLPEESSKNVPPSVVLHKVGDGIGFSSADPDFGSYASEGVNPDTSSGMIAVSADYLSDALTQARKMGAEKVRVIIQKGEADPIVVTDGKTFLSVMMPVRRSSLSEGSPHFVSPDVAEGAMSGWKESNPNAPRYRVVNDPSWIENGRGVRGQYVNGEMVINAAYAGDAATVAEVANHEWAHDTLASKQGQVAIAAFATRILPAADMAALERKYPRAAGESVAGHKVRLAEEWVAKNAEKNPGAWRKMVEAVRGWLSRMGMVTLTNEEASRAMLRQLRKDSAAKYTGANLAADGRQQALFSSSDERMSLGEGVAPESNKNLPDWAREEMVRRGIDPKRQLNDYDIANPSIRMAIESDPTLTTEQKKRILDTGSVGKPIPRSSLGEEVAPQPEDMAARRQAVDLALLAKRTGRDIETALGHAVQRYKAINPSATPQQVNEVRATAKQAIADGQSPFRAAPVAGETKPSQMPQSMQARGVPAQQIDYEVRNQEERREEAANIIKREGRAKAIDRINDQTLRGDTRVAIGGNLIADSMLRMQGSDAEQIAKHTADIKRVVAAMQPELSTESAQTLSMLNGIYQKDLGVGAAIEYVRNTQKNREKAMGGKEGSDVITDIQKLLKNAALKNENVIDQLKKKHTTKPAEKIINAFQKKADKIRELQDAGAFSREELTDILGKELGVEAPDPKKLGKISEISNRIRDAANHAQRSRAELDLAKELNIAKGVKRMDVLSSLLVANILSGYTTQKANIAGNVANTIGQVGVTAIANPTKIKPLLQGLFESLPEAFEESKRILKTGMSSSDMAEKTGSGGTLEIVDVNRDFGIKGTPGKVLQKLPDTVKYVFRFMKAADAVFFQPAREAYARVAATKLLEGQYKGEELETKVREALGILPKQFESARKQAIQEGYSGIDLGRRISDITQEFRKANTNIPKVVEDSANFAAETTFQNEPVGLAGLSYRKINEFVEQGRLGNVPVLKPWAMFLKTPANVFNTVTNYTPMGAIRAATGMMGSKVGTKRNFTSDERTRLIIQSTIGTALMSALLFRAMDKDNDMDITAKGPHEPDRKKQWEQAGGAEYSIKIGNTNVSYKDTPLLLPLAIVGHVRDSQKFEKQKSDMLFQNQVADAMATVGPVIFDLSMMTGMADLMGGLSGAKSMQGVMRTLASIPANTVIPFSRLLQQIDQTFDPTSYDSDIFSKSVPLLRRNAEPVLDVQSRPVTRQPMRRFGNVESTDPVDTVLREKRLFIPDIGKSEFTDRMMVNEKGERVRKPMTPEQVREYRRLAGERIRARLLIAAPRLASMPREKAQTYINDITKQAHAAVKPMASRFEPKQ